MTKPGGRLKFLGDVVQTVVEDRGFAVVDVGPDFRFWTLSVFSRAGLTGHRLGGDTALAARTTATVSAYHATVLDALVASCATLFSENDIQLTFWQHCGIETIICLYMKCNLLTKAVTQSTYTHLWRWWVTAKTTSIQSVTIFPPKLWRCKPNMGAKERLFKQIEKFSSITWAAYPHPLSAKGFLLLLYKCVNCVSANRAILSGRLQILCSKSQSQIACYTLYLNAKAVIKLRDKASFYIATQKLACFLITVNKLSLHGGLRS